MEFRKKVSGASVVACADPTKVLELIDEALIRLRSWGIGTLHVLFDEMRASAPTSAMRSRRSLVS
jgi:hypothetical protein